MKYFQYFGILLGALYGFILRLIMSPSAGYIINPYAFDIYTVSFIWIVPIAISIIPILFAKKELLDSRLKQILFPICSVLLFFIVTLTSGYEDWLCILILAFPFLLAAGIVGLLAGLIISSRHSNKLYSILLLPLLISPIEKFFEFKEKKYMVEKSVNINKEASDVWNYLLEVPEIKEEEYKRGLLNYLGVPRPVKSILVTELDQEYRMGYFTDGLVLKETIDSYSKNEFVEFLVDIEHSTLRNTPTDQHLLKSDYFKFNNIRYELDNQKDGSTNLVLSCEYSIKSNMNWYSNFWAKQIIGDFEQRLLEVLKLKIEKAN